MLSAVPKGNGSFALDCCNNLAAQALCRFSFMHQVLIFLLSRTVAARFLTPINNIITLPRSLQALKIFSKESLQIEKLHLTPSKAELLFYGRAVNLLQLDFGASITQFFGEFLRLSFWHSLLDSFWRPIHQVFGFL
jgi:hypothetical protein